jgi:hypothetical protein
MKETYLPKPAVSNEKNGLKKSISIAKARFFTWIRAIVFLVSNLKNIQEVINTQNRQIEETELLVNYLLKNTNRYMRRRWIRYLSYAEESGIWDASVIKLHPNEKRIIQMSEVSDV